MLPARQFDKPRSIVHHAVSKILEGASHAHALNQSINRDNAFTRTLAVGRSTRVICHAAVLQDPEKSHAQQNR